MVHQASGHQLISPRSCIPSFDHLGTLQDGHRTSVDCSLALNAAQRSFRTSSIRSILHPNAALQPCLNVGHGRVQHHFVTIQLKVHLRMKHHSNPSNKLLPKCILGIQSSGVSLGSLPQRRQVVVPYPPCSWRRAGVSLPANASKIWSDPPESWNTASYLLKW